VPSILSYEQRYTNSQKPDGLADEYSARLLNALQHNPEVGYHSVSAFIEMFRKMLETTPQMYFRSKQEPVPE